MEKITVRLDVETMQRLETAARKAGTSRSAWAREAIKEEIAKRSRADPRKATLHALFGSWKDERSPEEILADIRTGFEQHQERASFDD